MLVWAYERRGLGLLVLDQGSSGQRRSVSTIIPPWKGRRGICQSTGQSIRC